MRRSWRREGVVDEVRPVIDEWTCIGPNAPPSASCALSQRPAEADGRARELAQWDSQSPGGTIDRLPDVFCWTRIGTEAGQSVEQILARKEVERRANNGVFYWGIGTSIAPALRELVRNSQSPEVLFSPIKGRPRPVDVSPTRILLWTAGETLDGEPIQLPDTALVTSRGGEASEVGNHYALVCSAGRPLGLVDSGRLEFGSLRNLLSGNPVGASQVTAVVRRLNAAGPGDYLVAMRARLVAPYFLRLRRPVEILATPLAQLLNSEGSS
jgi:hypothetical protein